jgi:hypothetical protein
MQTDINCIHLVSTHVMWIIVLRYVDVIIIFYIFNKFTKSTSFWC